MSPTMNKPLVLANSDAMSSSRMEDRCSSSTSKNLFNFTGQAKDEIVSGSTPNKIKKMVQEDYAGSSNWEQLYQPKVSRSEGIEITETEEEPKRHRAKCRSLSDLEVRRFVGEGKFGVVYFARVKANKFPVALKVVFKKQLNLYQVKHHVSREIEMQSNFCHPNILRLYGVLKDHYRLYLIFEYASKGNLFEALHKQPNKRFEEAKVASYVCSLASALVYLHQRNIIHRDIKPEKLLLGEDGAVKISDFRYSIYSTFSQRSTCCGTLNYMPPEIVQGRPHNENLDIWCLGVLCFELLVGCGSPHGFPVGWVRPHKNFSIENYAQYQLPAHVSRAARHLLSKLLKMNPQQRMPLKIAQEHPWILRHFPQ